MPGRGCRGQGGNSLALNSQNTQEKMTSFPEPLDWLQLSTTPVGALCHRQILLCSCSLLVCLFLIPHLFQGRKRAPAASPSRAAPALEEMPGEPPVPLPAAATPAVWLQEGGSPASPASLCQNPLIKAGLGAEPTFPVTLPSLRTRCSVGKANLSELQSEGLHITRQGWEPSSISVAVPLQGSAQLLVHPKICFKRALCWGCLKI